MPYHDDVQDKKRKVANRPGIYTKDSRTSKWRQKKRRLAAASGCQTLDMFFPHVEKAPDPGPLLSDGEQELPSDIEPDPTLQFALDMRDIWASYLEKDLEDVPVSIFGEEDEAEVSIHICHTLSQ